MRAKCRTTGKVRYRTHAEAKAVLDDCTFKRRRLGKVYRMERSAYLCSHCDYWHLSSWIR